MPIQSPQLDDLRFDRTVEELVRRIPVHAPEWTDHNDSDPGIALIQLFAYLAEQVGYRLNRVPEKNHIELLKLLGVRLQPALAARTRLALLLADPATLSGYTLPAGVRAKAKKGEPPPTFESDFAIDVVPCETSVLIATKNPFLWDVLRREDGSNDSLPATDPEVPSNRSPWHAVVWDGKSPPLKNMPLEPVELFPDPQQRYLWIGLKFNKNLDAGFRGVRETLTIQLDDDEQPSLTKTESCQPIASGEPPPERVMWLAYYDATAAGTSGDPLMKEISGRIDDTTNRLERSGTIRFTVPLGLGPIPDSQWQSLRIPEEPSALRACLSLAETMQAELSGASPLGSTEFQTALTKGVAAHKTEAEKVKPPLDHPLAPTLRAAENVHGWLRIQMPPVPADLTTFPKLRMLTFNAVPMTQATTVTNELLGVSDGRPGQRFSLQHGNVLADSLRLAIQESADATVPLVTWEEIESLDTASPFDRVFELDREAGVIQFGSGGVGIHGGRIPPLVPGAGRVIAQRYRHGGGQAGEVAVASTSALETPANGVGEVVNFVAARGGRDAETLDEATLRARKEISSRSRAVTAGDFEWIARQTPAVRVARAVVVPLRHPAPRGTTVAPLAEVRCGPAPPTKPAGLDSITAAGAVSVVVIPDEVGPEPLPTPSFLRAVCQQLDSHRLVTTEVFVVPPQYLRLCNFQIVVKSQPGYTRSQIQDLVEDNLATYLHVLTGGQDGTGFPFGAQVHVSDLIARVFRTEGVERVESLRADFTRTKTSVALRQGSLVLCPQSLAEVDRVALSPEETVSIDLTTFTLSTVN